MHYTTDDVWITFGLLATLLLEACYCSSACFCVAYWVLAAAGLSVPQPLIDLLKGLPVYGEFQAARQHVRQQYKQLEQVFRWVMLRCCRAGNCQLRQAMSLHIWR
jgi:hypothetical protein